MRKCTTFQGLLKPLTSKLITNVAQRYDSDRYCKEFKTKDHLIVMIFAHIHQIKSLRELETAFNNHPDLKRLIGNKKVKRSTLSDANNYRTSASYLCLANYLMSALPRKINHELENVIRLLDSSPIQLKGWGYQWAKEHRTHRHQGLKLHIEYDWQSNMPVRMMLSHANYPDCTMGQAWPILANTIYVFDKGYCDYNWWWKINEKQAFFVTRLKENGAFEKMEERKVQAGEIQEDHLIKFTHKCPRGGKRNSYTESLRRIVIKRENNKKHLVIVTNLLNFSAETISKLYKDRWSIELFFKWIKQNLLIKKFLGRSQNAVKIQLATAIITYLLVGLFNSLFKKRLSLHHTLIWVRHNLLIKKNYRNKAPLIYAIPNRFMLSRTGGHL